MHAKSRLLVAIFLIALSFFSACSSGNPDADIAGIQLDMKVLRADSLMWEASKALLTTPKPDTFAIFERYLKPERDFFLEVTPLFDKFMRDSVSVGMQDTVLALYYGRILANPSYLALLDSVRKRFPAGYDFQTPLLPLFKRVRKLFPDAPLPQLRTYISGYPGRGEQVDANQIDQAFTSVSGKFYVLGLHYWMGTSFKFYPPDVPVFIKKRFEPRFLPAIVANQIAEDLVMRVDLRKMPTLLDKCVRAGIKQVLVDALVPNEPDSMRLYYSDKQMYWADYYEKNIYKELTPLLYNKDFSEHLRYMSDKPYTSELSLESAPRIGQYFGWKVVKAYLAKHPNVKLTDLLDRQDYETIWKESGYKP